MIKFLDDIFREELRDNAVDRCFITKQMRAEKENITKRPKASSDTADLKACVYAHTHTQNNIYPPQCTDEKPKTQV